MKNLFALGMLAVLLVFSPSSAQAFFGCCGSSCDSCNYTCQPCEVKKDDCCTDRCNDCCDPCCDWTRTEVCDSFYGRLMGGAVFFQDSTNRYSNAAREDYDYDIGYAVIGGIGYRWNCGLALEGEVSYRSADIDEVAATGGTVTSDGDVSVLAFMANAYYYFCLCNRWNPYVGVGIGYATVDFDQGPGATLLHDHDGVFAYQAILGIAYQWSCNFDLNMEYRFFGTSDPDLHTAALTLDSEVMTHTLGIGFTWHFM